MRRTTFLKEEARDWKIWAFVILCGGKKQRDPSVHPLSCPEEKCCTQYSVLWWCRVWSTVLMESSGRTISQHVENATAAAVSLTGAKNQPQRWKAVPNRDVAVAPWLQAESGPRGARNKAKLKLVHEPMIRAQWYSFYFYSTALYNNSQGFSCQIKTLFTLLVMYLRNNGIWLLEISRQMPCKK